ncbi:MAG: Hexuronate transporter [Syntrophorhabdus sp. PtaU1.Bin050]|nr:MAG: Hexuronate transporter [Syntrophorhabdus sp. PtaU1.Bin050]
MVDPYAGRRPVIHWAWVILTVCFVNLFVNYSIRLGYGVVLPEMIRTMGLTRLEGGDIFNAYLFAYICLSPFAGNLTDRLGARRIVPLFGIILGLGALLMGTATSFRQACLFFALTGVGASSMWTPIITLVQRWFSVKRRGMALGILSAGFGLGFASMGKLFPVIVSHWNWRYCWYLLGVAALVMVVVNIVLLRSRPEDKGLGPWGESNPGDPVYQQTPPGTKERGRYPEIVRASRFWVIGFSYFLIAGALYIITTYMVDYARYELGLPYEKASMLATVHGMGQIVGVLCIGLISDYIGRRMTILASNLFISAAIVSIVAAGANPAWLFGSIGVLGAFYGATFPMYGATGGDYFRKEIMGTVIGLLTFFYGCGAIVAHRVAGHIRDATGSFTIPFMLAIAASFLAAILMAFVRQPVEKEAE